MDDPLHRRQKAFGDGVRLSLSLSLNRYLVRVECLDRADNVGNGVGSCQCTIFKYHSSCLIKVMCHSEFDKKRTMFRIEQSILLI